MDERRLGVAKIFLDPVRRLWRRFYGQRLLIRDAKAGMTAADRGAAALFCSGDCRRDQEAAGHQTVKAASFPTPFLDMNHSSPNN